MRSTQSNNQAPQRQKQSRNNNKKTTFNRQQGYNKQPLCEATFRLSNTSDGRMFLAALEYLVTQMKVTYDGPSDMIRPDPVACQWQSAGQWILNNISKWIQDGKNPPIHQEYEKQSSYEDPRGVFEDDDI